jgi:hypothetical protein
MVADESLLMLAALAAPFRPVVVPLLGRLRLLVSVLPPL